MTEEQINKQLNRLWATVRNPERIRGVLYSHVRNGSLEELIDLIKEYPVLREIIKIDPSLTQTWLRNFQSEVAAYLIGELNLDFGNSLCFYQITPLSSVIVQTSHIDHVTVELNEVKFRFIQTLLDLGANPNSTTFVFDRKTPLHNVIQHLNSNNCLPTDFGYRIVEELLQHNANPNWQDCYGQTALHLLILAQSVPLALISPVIQLLLDYGADEDLVDRYGRTSKMCLIDRFLDCGR